MGRFLKHILVTPFLFILFTPWTTWPADLVISNAVIFTGEKMGVSRGDIVVQEGTIQDVLPQGGASGTQAAHRLDAGGDFIMPGLIDAHTHMLRAGSCGRNEGVGWDNIRQIVMNFDVALSAGNTTVVDLGGPLNGVLAIRNFERDIPRYLVAGPIITAKNGYPFDWAPRDLVEDLVVGLEVETGEQAKKAVQRLKRAGVDVIKIAAMERSYNLAEIPIISQEAMNAAVSEAHSCGLRVFVHAHGREGYQRALDAGADVIAHSSFEPLTDDMIREIKDKGVVVIPTLWVFSSFLYARDNDRILDELRPQLVPGFFADLSDFHRRMTAASEELPDDFMKGLKLSLLKTGVQAARENLSRLKQAGVRIAFGTDTSFCYALHGAAYRELSEMTLAGLTPGEALQAATYGSALALGRKDLGVIRKGAAADFVVLKGNPLDNLEALKEPAAVILKGKVVRCNRKLLGTFCPEGTSAGPHTPGFFQTIKVAIELLRALYLR